MSTGTERCSKRFKDGVDIRFIFERVGYSAKMNELEAAVGLGNIKAWPGYLARRRENLLYLLENFRQFEPELLTFKEEKHEFIGPHAFPVLLGEKVPFSRDEFVDYLSRRGVDSRNMFLAMPTQCPGFEYLGYKLGQFPEAEYVGRQGLHIGLHQDLNLEHMKYFIKVVKDFIKGHK
jgi:dTDP-4-amino-4,6-dideoxygalactose transaminase